MTEYLSIQYLRGVAALSVVLFHLGAPLARMGYAGGWPIGLSAGVDIFFVISGFVMWLTTRSRSTTTLGFWWKRIVRIVPLYWIVTSVMLSVMLAAPQLMRSSVFDLHHVVASYAFVPWVNPARPEMQPLVFPGWTLNFEMFFYLIFGLCLRLKPLWRLGVMVGIFAGLVAAGTLFAPSPLSAFGFYTRDIVLDFGFGIVLAELFVRPQAGVLLGARGGIVAVAIGAAVILMLPRLDAIPWSVRFGLPAFLIVAGALSCEFAGRVGRIRPLLALGAASYSIYLTQLISMAAFTVGWQKAGLDALPGAMILFCLLNTAIVLIAGCACYRWVEKPLMRLFRRRTGRRSIAITA